VVDLDLGTAIKTLEVGDEPSDIAFAGGKAFVAVSQEDAVKVFNLANLDAPPAVVELFSRDVRALAASKGGTEVYAVTLRSGNQTTVVDANVIFGSGLNQDPARLAGLGLNPMDCDSPAPAYPPLPSGITRNPALTDPGNGIPEVGLIVQWNEAAGRWEDDAGQNWTDCLPFRLPDHDLFIIDAGTLSVTEVDHLGTSLFEVSVHPTNDKIYVPHTESRNQVRFEHALGVQGHLVDNRMAIVDPGAGHTVTLLDLNTHINRTSDPATNLSERVASISQPGMMAWRSDGLAAYLTAIGSRKLFRVNGSTTDATLLFGPDRSSPDVVEVGEGPTGVALHEGTNRAYVLNRISHSIAVVNVGGSSMTVDRTIALHDPSPEETRVGRRFLYDGIDSSAHGDAACSSCHLSGDMDGLAWDLGNPEGDFVPYANANDNVRFIIPLNDVPTECPPSLCAAHEGFDPQKGPMTTQSLRGMLEPLHWRGDRATMNDFNGAFVGLMGKENVGAPSDPKGLSDADMEKFRQFALRIMFPPNPNRNVNDTVPSISFQPPGHPFTGDPASGEFLFDNHNSDAGQKCASCHTHPFGAADGQLGGVTPAEPASSATSALFNGDADGSPHSDLEVPHLRNMYEKFGATFGTYTSPPDRKTGFGFIHDGSIQDMGTFLSASVFTLDASQAADIASFMFFWPTSTKPAVGRHVTLPHGTPPTGSSAEEALLAELIAGPGPSGESLGDMADPQRHCELTAAALSGGRMSAWRLEGVMWIPDVTGGTALSTTQLRETAEGPLSFLCATIGSGQRLGGDLDEDTFLNGDDCGPADAGAWAEPVEVVHLAVDEGSPTHLGWDGQESATGPGLTYDVAGGTISGLASAGLDLATSCIGFDLAAPEFDDARPDPASGDGYYYLVRAVNSCLTATFGPGREFLDALICP
jgi:DNA-binding beta-propeller fold protein YncE